MGLSYFLTLAVALTGMVLIDRRFALIFWADARRASIVLALGVAFFLAWDVCGIGLGIFFRGETRLMTGVLVGPELPIEEIFFLALLCYLSMNLVAFIGPRLRGRA